MEPVIESVVWGEFALPPVRHFGHLIYVPELHAASLLLQTEIAKRLNTILAQIMPFLSQEVRPFTVSSFSFQSSPAADRVPLSPLLSIPTA